MAYTTIDDPSAHFQIALYTGQGGTATAVTNDGNSDLQPDLIFFKSRTTTARWNVMDSTRGTTKVLYADGNDAQATDAGSEKPLDSFNSDGFQAGESLDHHTNINTASMCAWQWKANGGTTTTNDSSSTGVGNVDSVYQANTTAGFSIVTFPADNTAGRTVAHGLGVAPRMIITKGVAQTSGWYTYHYHAGANTWMVLHDTTAATTNTGIWGNTHPTSSIFTIGNNETGYNNGGANESLAYCFAPIQGYSKFGSYTGNGDADGAFVYLGFKPAFIMVKATDVDEWRMYDHKRANAHNVIDVRIIADTTAAESQDDNECDFLSNGVKFRSSSGGVNSSGQAYVYMAFAEHPFVSSEGVPVTAR